MKETIVVTQAMVDYVESHREGNIRYDKDFKIKVGEESYITGISLEEHHLLFEMNDGRFFSMPDSVVGVVAEDIQKKWDEEQLRHKMEEKRKQQLLNTDWNDVRIKTAMAVMQSICSNEKVTKFISKKVADVSVTFADALIKRLQKPD